ncbi:hypothetical protein TELCIR_05958, partial [Teladorsagia circumcincta]
EMPRHGGSGVVKEKDKDKDGAKEKSHGKEKHRERTDRKVHADNERVGPSTTRRMSDSERKHSVRPTDELKLLQDSLTQFFTPSAGRRCRQPPRKFDESGVNSDDSVHVHTVTSDPSPSRRMCEKLVDSLSPYFSTSSEKRRTTQKGEFAQLNSGRTRIVVSNS